MLSRKKKKGLHYRSQEQSSSDWRSVQGEKETKNKPTKHVKQKKKKVAHRQPTIRNSFYRAFKTVAAHAQTHARKKKRKQK